MNTLVVIASYIVCVIFYFVGREYAGHGSVAIMALPTLYVLLHVKVLSAFRSPGSLYSILLTICLLVGHLGYYARNQSQSVDNIIGTNMLWCAGIYLLICLVISIVTVYSEKFALWVSILGIGVVALIGQRTVYLAENRDMIGMSYRYPGERLVLPEYTDRYDGMIKQHGAGSSLPIQYNDALYWQRVNLDDAAIETSFCIELSRSDKTCISYSHQLSDCCGVLQVIRSDTAVALLDWGYYSNLFHRLLLQSGEDLKNLKKM